MNASLLFLLLALVSVFAKKEPTITNKVFFDIEIDGVPAGRIVMGMLSVIEYLCKDSILDTIAK